MAKYKLTHKAVDDLTQIWNYTMDKWSERQADKYYYLLIESIKEITDAPDLGKNYSEVTENLLGYRAGRHIIFYRKIGKDEIEITRILHEQMDLKNRVKDK
ncbi:MAG: type II toxin-antitoxin system RelE/ParE family toxin [Mangrovibacterium sp.]